MERKTDFVNFIQTELKKKVKYNKTSLEKIAASYGIVDANNVKEYTELAIVNEARKIAHEAGAVKNCFDFIVNLYNNQVNLSHRTSQSMLLQQYSTPAPIGYIAGMFCRFNDDAGYYFEPSAGNGLLTIAGNSNRFYVNEIDDVRRSNLETQGFLKVTNQDATAPFPETYLKKFDAIITNPPFGKLDNSIDFDGFPIGVLDHLMCVRALDTMKDSGRAALIIGGHTTWDEKGRIQAGKNRIFFNYLHSHYNVLDTLNIDGHKLYSRQGTAFNVRLILIEGRKLKPEGFAPLFNSEKDKVIFSFDKLFERVYQFIPSQNRKGDTIDYNDIKVGDTISVWHLGKESDKGKVLFKYGRHYLILGNDKKSTKYTVFNVFRKVELPEATDIFETEALALELELELLKN